MAVRDIEFLWSFRGGSNPIPVTAAGVRQIGRTLFVEMRKELREVANELMLELKRAYAAHRGPGRLDGERELADKIISALHFTVHYLHGDPSQMPELFMGVLNLQVVRAATGETLPSGRFVSVYDLVEDGHTGLQHGSRWYGFLPIESARQLAMQCAAELHLPQDRANKLLKYVDEKFQGKYGRGIMVKLEDPLFYGFPEFGTALEHGVEPHPGFTAWNVVQAVGQRREGHLMHNAMRQAITTTEARMLAGKGSR